MTTQPLRGHRRTVDWERVGYGLFQPRRLAPDDLAHDPARARLQLDDLPAWSLVLPPDGCFTGLTAAGLLGWWLPPLPDRVPVFAATGRLDVRPRRPGLLTSRLVRPDRVRLRAGVPLDQPAEVLLRLARDVGVLASVVLLDAALRQHDVVSADVAGICERPRPGVRVLRRALALADPRSESSGETLLRVLHVVSGVPVEPQYVVTDAHGGFVARADLRVRGTTSLHEYDGADHLERPRQRKDLARQRRLEREAWSRRGYVLEDVLHTPFEILRDADDALGRPHRPERLQPWLDLVRRSPWSPAGRAVVQQRWAKAWR